MHKDGSLSVRGIHNGCNFKLHYNGAEFILDFKTSLLINNAFWFNGVPRFQGVTHKIHHNKALNFVGCFELDKITIKLCELKHFNRDIGDSMIGFFKNGIMIICFNLNAMIISIDTVDKILGIAQQGDAPAMALG